VRAGGAQEIWDGQEEALETALMGLAPRRAIPASKLTAPATQSAAAAAGAPSAAPAEGPRARRGRPRRAGAGGVRVLDGELVAAGAEVQGLMEMFACRIPIEAPELHREGVRTRFLGRREALSDELSRQLHLAEPLTKANARDDPVPGVQLWRARRDPPGGQPLCGRVRGALPPRPLTRTCTIPS
jgi:hypothetical protein